MIQFLKDRFREYVYQRTLEFNKDELAEEDPEALRVYCLVRADILPPLHCGIQAAHALVELARKYGHLSEYQDWVDNHKTIVLLSGDYVDFKTVKTWCNTQKIPSASFIEPDLGDLETSLALFPLPRAVADSFLWEYPLAR